MTDAIPMKIYSRTFSSLFTVLVVGALLTTASVFAADTQADLDAHMKDGKAAYDQKKQEEAFQHYIWCYDNGVAIDSGFAKNRDTRVLTFIVSIGKKYPPAKAAIVERREALVAKVKADPKKADEGDVRQLGYLDLAVSDDATILATLAVFPEGKTNNKAYGSVIQARLIETKHYKEAVSVDDFDENAANLEKMARNADKMRREGKIDETGVAKLKASALKAAPRVEMYAGMGDLKRAKQIVVYVVNISPDPEVVHKVAEYLRRGGAIEMADKLEGTPKK